MTGNEEVMLLLENLIQTAVKHKITVCGFAFAVKPPFFTNFGNCSDAGDIRLYQRLTEVYDKKRKTNAINKIRVTDNLN